MGVILRDVEVQELTRPGPDNHIAVTEPAAHSPDAAPLPGGPYLKTWRRLYWLAVPVLAVAAYGTVLRIGFLSDDFVWLREAALPDSRPLALVPDPGVAWKFYRPLSGAL